MPEVTVGKFEEASRLLDRIAEEKQGLFIAKAAGYRERHRQATDRPLRPEEAAQVAAALAESINVNIEDAGPAVRSIQRSDLRAYDEPEPREVLLAAGVATGPALIEAVKQFVSLIELSDSEFEEACETGTLDETLDQAAGALRGASLKDARERARRALDHFADAAGVGLGEAWSLLVSTIGQALLQAVPNQDQSSSSLTGSLAPTSGDDETSSTEPPSATPANSSE